MKTEKRRDGWWVVNVPPYRVDGETCTDCGPYKTRDEAAADLAGLARFYRDHPEYAADAVPTTTDGKPQVDQAARPEAATRTMQRTLFG